MTDSPLVTLKASAKEFNFDTLKAGENNKSANSGQTMYNDINRMKFVINGKTIDQSLILAFKNGAKKHEFDKLWKDHCEVADNQKTNSYKKEFEEFYNSGLEYTDLLANEKEDYRAFAKEVFKKMFIYAKAQIPNDAILEELITNCNQAGYESSLHLSFYNKLSAYGLIAKNPNKSISIECTDPTEITVKSEMTTPINYFDNPEENMCNVLSSLSFTLKSNNNEVTYENGDLSLIIPEKMKNHKDSGKSLFDFIKECFQNFCEKLGFKFEEKVTHRFNETYLKEVKPPVNVLILTPKTP